MSAPNDPPRRLTIPVFPLSTVVLFPGADCPLHVFEPRYRQMTEGALAGAGLIGMVTVRPEHTGEMAGDPPVFPIGSLGRISQSQVLEDGRINIVLHGTSRFRIRGEPPRPDEQLYRSAIVEPLDETPADPVEVSRRREQVTGAFLRLVELAAPERAEQIGTQQLAELDDAGFMGALIQMLNLPPVERQSLLEANGVAERLAALESLIRFQLVGLGLGPKKGPDRVH